MPFKRYNLNMYAQLLKRADLIQSEELYGQENTEVKGLAYHSNDVKPGTLFVCKGHDFQKEYLIEAAERGAVGYIAETKYDLEDTIPYLGVSDIRLAMASIADVFYNSPQQKLTLIGVGGTKGKTTTVYYIKAILDEHLKNQGKQPAGLLSTIAVFDGQGFHESVNTTPEAIDLQRYLANAVEAGLEYMVMEISSQALKYHRTKGLKFDIGVFLNIEEDHISPLEHTDFDDYLASKVKMFEQTKTLIVNKDTKEKDIILEKAHNADHYYTYSVLSQEADYVVSEITSTGLNSQFDVHSERINETYKLSMAGEFNVENALAAIAVSDQLGIPQHEVKQALSTVKVPGRMEMYATNDEKIIAVSDYAHNRLSFETLIVSMRKNYPGYKIISIFGAPGGKALGRRKELGEVGGQYSDYVILTMDDPAYETVEDISNEIALYIEEKGTPFQIISNREAAIREAFKQAESNTIILAIGKGHETTMRIKNQRIEMRSDDQIIQEQIKAYNQEH